MRGFAVAPTIAATLVLGGCAAMTPSGMRSEDKPFATLSLEGEPMELAECARVPLINDPPNALNPPTPIIVTDDKTVSIIGNARDATVYVADLSPGGTDTRAVVYASKQYAYRQSNGEAVVDALESCG